MLWGQSRTCLSPEEMNNCVGMLESGVSQCHVAWIFNVSQRVISQMRNPYLTHGYPSHRHSGGHNRATTQCQSHFLLIQSRRRRFSNATSLKHEFWNGTGVCISTQTVRNRHHEFGLNVRGPSIPLPQTRQHLQDRLDFARTHVRWTIRDWTPVLFTDVSRFCLHFTDRHQLVRRMPKQRFDELNVAEHDHYVKGLVMVWAGISVNGKLTCTLLKTEH